MSTEEKFHAAVNVIRSLPKNGSYQPSNELLLRFYAYFKQATIGPCQGPKPAFWDVVGKAKYNAWQKLGDMSKHDAMQNYVAELHRIVETMSYNDNVANFLEAQNELESVNIKDLEMVAGDVIERVRSQPNSPFGSREASPQRVRSSVDTSPASSLYSHSPDPQDESDHSDEEYIDTIDVAPEPVKKPLTNGYIPDHQLSNGHINKEPTISRSRPKSKNTPTSQEITNAIHKVDLSQEIHKTMQSLKQDLERLSNRITSLEKNSQTNNVTALAKNRNYVLSFKNISPSLLAFMIIWPFVTHSLLRYWSKRK